MTPDSRTARGDVRAAGVRTPADGLPYYLPTDAQRQWYELLWPAVVALHARYTHADRPCIPAAWWERARDTETLAALTALRAELDAQRPLDAKAHLAYLADHDQALTTLQTTPPRPFDPGTERSAFDAYLADLPQPIATTTETAEATSWQERARHLERRVKTRERDAHQGAADQRARDRLEQHIANLNDEIQATRARLDRAQRRTDHLASTAVTQTREQLARLKTELADARAQQAALPS